MSVFLVVQLDNATPTLLENAKSIIHGMDGLFILKQRWSGVATRFSNAV